MFSKRMEDMLTVLSVFGTRPEAIKMAPLVKHLAQTAGIRSLVCVTAQHRQMLDSVLEQFHISPDYDLNLMRRGQTLTSITVGVLEGMEEVLRACQPDLVLVHGDTTTSTVAALAAFYQQIPVGHVEAGLRSFDRYSPFPEEMNRQLTGRIAELHFAPTRRARENLARENVTENVYVVGNTVIDALHQMVHDAYRFHSPELTALDLSQGRWIVMTAHRRENLGEHLEAICRGVLRLVAEHPDVHLVYPVHPNPAVRSVAEGVLGGHDRVHLIQPVEVEDMHNLMKRCYMVMTDSGGLQEEAPALGKPVVVLRTETERPEVVEAGMALLAGVEEQHVYEAGERLLTDAQLYHAMAHAINPYGDGHTSEKIAQIILDWGRARRKLPMKLGKRILRQGVCALPLSLFTAFTVTLFAATQTLWENTAELWFSWEQMAGGVALAGGIAAAILTLVLAVLPKKAYACGQAALLALSLATFLQGNGLNASYGELNGKAIDWSAYTMYGVTNTLLWLGMLFIALNLRHWKRFTALCVALPLVLLAGETGLTGYWAANMPEKEDSAVYLSDTGLYTVGSEKNLLVMVLDSVDSEDFAQALTEDASLAETLDGFVWYKNAMGVSDPTKHGIPALLTGKAYTSATDYSGFIAWAYADTPLYQQLAGADWDARFFTDDRYLTLDESVIDNLEREELAVSDAKGLTHDLLQLCAFRYAPHFVKPQLWMYGNVFRQYAKGLGGEVYKVTDEAFDAQVTEAGLTVQPGNAFRMIHLTGMHPPYTMDADCQYQESGVDAAEQMRGCMKQVRDYLTQLKDVGRYEDAAILILADHGTETVHRPMLLLKRPGASGALTVSEAPVSYADLPATYTALLTGTDNDEALWNVPADTPRTRLYYHENSRNNEFNLYEYETQVIDPVWEDLQPTGQVYHGDTLLEPTPYVYGTTLYFDLRATARPYLVSGFSSADFYSTWTSGQTGEITLPLAKLPEGDRLTVKLHFLSVMTGSQRMTVSCGGKTVYDGTVTDNAVEFTIPAELVTEPTLTLDFTWPDAVSHQELGLSDDTRQVAFAVADMIVLDGE